jgi:hypothetical protein
VAGKCAAALGLQIPVYVDDMKNSVATAYDAMPDRLFFIGVDGKIAYRGARGPRGFKPEELAKKLAEQLAVE